MNDTASPEVFAMLGAAVSVQLVQKLAAKGILTEQEMLEIFYRAIDGFMDDDHRVQAVQALQSLMPALQVQTTKG